MAAAAEDDAEVRMFSSSLFRRGFRAGEDCAQAEEGEDEEGGGGEEDGEDEEDGGVHVERFGSCVIGRSYLYDFKGARMAPEGHDD